MWWTLKVLYKSKEFCYLLPSYWEFIFLPTRFTPWACGIWTLTQCFAFAKVKYITWYILKYSLSFWNHDFCRSKARHCMGVNIVIPLFILLNSFLKLDGLRSSYWLPWCYQKNSKDREVQFTWLHFDKSFFLYSPLNKFSG